MAKRRKRRSREPTAPSRLWVVFTVLIVLAVAAGLLWRRAPETVREQVRRAAKDTRQTVERAITRSHAPPPDRSLAFAGLPRPTTYPHPVLVLTNTGYISAYCETRQNPVWVVYRVFRARSTQEYARPSRFRIDDRTRARVAHDDFTRSGFDRGHMAPSYAIAMSYGQEAQIETFLMSNIVPQRPGLNRGIWKELEQLIANRYVGEFEEIWVITGPVFDERVSRLSSGVEIPDAFFKIIVDEIPGGPRVLAFLVDHDSGGGEELSELLSSVDAIEQQTGFDFLSELDDRLEDQLEALRAVRVW